MAAELQAGGVDAAKLHADLQNGSRPAAGLEDDNTIGNSGFA